MEEVHQEEKKPEKEEEKNKDLIKNNELPNKELKDQIPEKKESESEMNNLNNENNEILKDNSENNINEKNDKKENYSSLQKDINDKKEKFEDKVNESNQSTKENKTKMYKKTKKEKTNNKEKINQKKEDMIYSRDHFHNENILKYIKQRKLKEISECSFKPKINKKIGFEVTKIDNNKDEDEKKDLNQNKDVVERLLLWKERVKQKLNNIKDKKEKEESEREKCTFYPKLKTDVPKFDNKEIIGNEKYYNRIKNSRKIKKQKENMLNPNYNELYNKYYKHKEKTVLKKNEKVSKKTYQNYLNHFHNVLMNDDE